MNKKTDLSVDAIKIGIEDKIYYIIANSCIGCGKCEGEALSAQLPWERKSGRLTRPFVLTAVLAQLYAP